MKKVLFAIALLCVVVSITQAQDLISPVSIGGIKVKLWGFSQSSFENAVEPEAQWYKGRIYAKTEGLPVTIFLQTQPIGGGNLDSDFLHQLYAEYEIKGFTLKGGRILVAGGWTTPAPFALKTVRYPRVPASFYTYGIQVGRNISRFCLLADVSGATGKIFYENDNFDRVEFSGRISGPLHGIVTAVSTQLSKDFKRFTLDAEYKACSVICKGALYIASQDVDRTNINSRGGYLLVAVSLLSWLELHSQIDYRSDDPGGNSTIWTNGLRIWAKNNQVALTVDYVSQTHRPIGRLQFRY